MAIYAVEYGWLYDWWVIYEVGEWRRRWILLGYVGMLVAESAVSDECGTERVEGGAVKRLSMPLVGLWHEWRSGEWIDSKPDRIL